MINRALKKEVKSKDLKENLENNKMMRIIHYLNYWIIGLFSILRALDYIFSYIAISSGIGVELNPIGFNVYLIIVGFFFIPILLIINYKVPNIRILVYLILIIISLNIVLQTVVTFNAISLVFLGETLF